MRVLFDTNALLIPFKFSVNPYQGVRGLIPGAGLITLEECVTELKGLRPRKWESILSLAVSNGLSVVESGLKAISVDDLIVKYAKRHDCLVFTQDRLLKKKLLNDSLRVVIMRQQRRFEVIG